MDRLYNFWTDGDHPRGIYRRTGWESYLGGSPDWETVLDIDALVAEEGTRWACRDMNCLLPEERICMVCLSPGGSNAVEAREFDLLTRDTMEVSRSPLLRLTWGSRERPGWRAAKMIDKGHEVLYFGNVEGGHGSGVTPEQQAESMALAFTYLHVRLRR